MDEFKKEYAKKHLADHAAAAHPNEDPIPAAFRKMIAENATDPNLPDMIYGSIVYVLTTVVPVNLQDRMWSSLTRLCLRMTDAIDTD